MSETKASKLPATAKATVKVQSTLTANFDHVVTAKVGRLELALNKAVTNVTNQITDYRNQMKAEQTAIAAWARKQFVDPALLKNVPAALGLKLSFSQVNVQLSEQESTASWDLLSKRNDREGTVVLNSFSQEIPAEQTAKYFAFQASMAQAESNLVALRRELSQLNSKERILRGAAAEAQLREQGLGSLLDDIDDTDILSLPDNVAALLSGEKLIEQK